MVAGNERVEIEIGASKQAPTETDTFLAGLAGLAWERRQMPWHIKSDHQPVSQLKQLQMLMISFQYQYGRAVTRATTNIGAINLILPSLEN